MPTFQQKKFRAAGDAGRLGARYRALLSRHPFLTFGLPFLAVMVAGSFVLTPATAVRYERHDRKVRQMTKEEELNVRRAARKVDMREEYYVSLLTPFPPPFPFFLLVLVGYGETRKLCSRSRRSLKPRRRGDEGTCWDVTRGS